MSLTSSFQSMRIEQTNGRDAHKEVLELVARGAPIHDVLNALVRAAQGVADEGTRAAIFIVDPQGVSLRFAVTAGMPDSYARLIDGFPIGPTQPSCGRAAYIGQVVIVRDVAEDALWAPFLPIAHEYGIGACWSFPLCSPSGKVLGSLALYHRAPREPNPRQYDEVRYLADIAALVIERHHAAEERDLEQRRTEEALKDANRRKDEFLAMLAHELRNPLAPIALAAEVLRLRGGGDAGVQRQQEVIARNVRHLARMIDDLLEVSRINEGKIELCRERIELASVIDQAVTSARGAIEARGHELYVITPPQPVHLEADATRLVQVLVNLLNNAAKYTPSGGKIALVAAQEGDEAVIVVRDDGAGIPEDLLPRVFDLFVQGEQSLARSGGGLGIGLTLVQRLVRMHGGTVEAFSAGVGKGSEFVVRLPAEPGPVPEGRFDAPLMSSMTVGGAVRGRRVLLVEDNYDAAEMLAEALAIWGHEARVVHDGALAIQAAVEFRPEVVLLDLGLPGIDGLELARRLRAEPSFDQTLLVALTGYADAEHRHLTREAGFDHHLAKPVDMSALQALFSQTTSLVPAG